MSVSKTFRQLSIRYVTFHQLPSTFCLSVENILCGSCTFRLTSDNFLCGCVTFRQLSMHLWYHPSSFSASAGYSVNVSCVRRTFCKPMWTLCAPEEPSFSSPCDRRTFCKLPSTFVHSWELLLTFRAIVGPSVTFMQLSEWSWVVLPTFVNFAWVRRTFRQLPSNFHGSTGTSVNIFFIRGTFRQHQSTFRASAGLTVSLRQLIVKLRDLLPTFRTSGWPSVNIPCVRRTCQLRSTSLYYSVVQAVQQGFLPWTHEIFSYDSCYFHYSVVPAVRLCWTSLN